MEDESKLKIGKEQKEAVHAKATDLGDGELEAIIATDDLDRDGEILDMDGLDTRKFMKNPVVPFAHNYDQPPVAKCTELIKEGGKLKARLKFAIAEYPFAGLIYNLYKGGFMNAFSIGFIPKEGEFDEEKNGFRFTKSEMLEFSAVPVPANGNALITARSKGLNIDLVKQVAEGEKKVEDITEEDTKTDPTEAEVKEIEIKEGRTLSQKNFEKLTQARDSISAVLDAAQPAEGKSVEDDNSTTKPSIQQEKSEGEKPVSRLVKKIKRVKILVVK